MKLRPSILAALAIAILSTILFGCGSVDPVARYAKEHRDYSYESRMKTNEAFTPKSARSAVKQARFIEANREASRKSAEKRDRIYSKIKK